MKKHIYLSLLLGSAILASCSSDPKEIADNTKPVQVTLSNRRLQNPKKPKNQIAEVILILM